jgi:DHA2 family multidrug resistance protein
MTSQSGMWDAQVPLIIRGLGFGCIFIPLNVVGFNTLFGADIAQGSALMNLSRQLGGSFGIAILSTYVDNMQAYHRTVLVTHASMLDETFRQVNHQLAALLYARSDMPMITANHVANAFIDQKIVLQAATFAYDNAFLIMGVSMLVVAPVILLLKKVRVQQHAPMPVSE